MVKVKSVIRKRNYINHRKLALYIFLALDLTVLLWLVWMPAPITSTTVESTISYQIFNLPIYLDWLGNFLLLVPTTFLVRNLWDHLSTRTLEVAFFIFACIIELVQFHIPGRDPDWRDVTANTVGAVLSLKYYKQQPKAA